MPRKTSESDRLSATAIAHTTRANLHIPETETLEQVAARYQKYPSQFVQETFLWGTPHTPLATYQAPLAWQQDVLNELESALADNHVITQFAISAGKGVGKTTLCAWLFLWHVACHEGRSHSLVTSVTGVQTQSRVWREVRQWRQAWTLRPFFDIQATKLQCRASDAWYGMNQTWSNDNTEGFQGLHEQHVMIIADEASGIPDTILEVIESGATGPQVIILYASNPTRSTGRFRECFRRNKTHWQTWIIDARDVPIVSEQSITKQLAECHGDVESASFRRNVRGEFPDESYDQMVPEAIINHALARHTTCILPLHMDLRIPVLVGATLASVAGTKTVFVARQQHHLLETIVFDKQESDDTAQVLITLMDKYRNWGYRVIAFCDAHGLDMDVITLCERAGHRITHVRTGAGALEKDRYLNRRTELWQATRKFFHKEGCLTATDGKLCEQLQNCFFTIDTDGRGNIETKSQIMERGLDSPDVAEALSLTFAQQTASIPTLDLARGFQGTSNYKSSVPGMPRRHFAADYPRYDDDWTEADSRYMDGYKNMLYNEKRRNVHVDGH